MNAATAHHGHRPLIEITGAGALPRRMGYGGYEEEYRRMNGEWKISFMRLARLHLWSEPIAGVDVNAKTRSSSEQWL
ncbi:hypothetical protein [Pseudarthrobacter sp. fls2-241-R2A-168]|uniref:hypothetical protein n=1 Tax=Pseudarthrobacter sp. fls2-241-R2A-168 TaxID=3040304 RepID=UPI002554149C|nr:hypothetical protein [Pseudarthrobacter sp. fls2-241-R2A-168]